MLAERIEGKWIDSFAAVFRLCKVRDGEAVAILSETQSRAVNVQLAELALQRFGARPFHIVLPTPAQSAPVPVRSTGASNAVQNLAPVVAGLAAAGMIVDLTVEGMLHAPELPAVLKDGARLLMVSNEHPDALERLVPDPALEGKVKAGIKLLKSAKTMHVTSDAGSDLRIDLEGARPGGVWGWCDRPGMVSHWPGGLCLCFPRAGAVEGTLVMAPGDVNLTFKRYLESPVRFRIEKDYGLDVELTCSYLEAWGDRNAYAVSHVGWGMNPRARWDAMAMYDKRDFNGTELRAFAGNFLYSTGANEVAGHHTRVIVERGVLQGELA
jgi:2,5-dihydroxypyridine 5,6-dioxygenase